MNFLSKSQSHHLYYPLFSLQLFVFQFNTPQKIRNWMQIWAQLCKKKIDNQIKNLEKNSYSNPCHGDL